jgi:hypothetical protein
VGGSPRIRAASRRAARKYRSPQRIGIWISDDKAEGSTCDGWLALIDLASIGPENFNPVESGALVPPA